MSDATRRTFCAVLCQAAAGAAVAGARQNSALPIVRGEVDGDRIVVRVASTVLAAVGGRARVASTTGAFLVSRSGERDFVALTGTCSHESCQITDAEADAYLCPCHESKFNANGEVVRGPAELPLQQYETMFGDGVLTITVA